MNKEEIKDYITELESMFELSELEEHKRNILKVGNYIKQLQQENQKCKEVIDKAINELFNLKDVIYKPETREENIDIQRKISSIIKDLNVKEVE